MKRLGNEDGFGLVELLIAMTVLAIGILALVAGLSSGYVSLRRASTQATAAAVADQQMERFRGLRWDDIALNTGLSGQDSIYTGDTAYSGTVAGGCTSAAEATCKPVQSVTAADGRTYRLDTYIRLGTLNPGDTRQLKLVTVVVRSSDGTTEHAREQSTFDKCTGLAPTDTAPCST